MTRRHLRVWFAVLLPTPFMLTAISSQAAEDSAAVAYAKSLSQVFRMAAEGASPSVVTVIARYKAGQTPRARRMRELLENPRFREMFPDGLPFELPEEGPGAQEGFETHIGSGVIIEGRGVVLTNNHVVEDADRVIVRLHDGTELDADDIRTDWMSDLAILQVDPEDRLPAAKLGNSESLAIGDWVIAIGSPFELETTVSAGIISAKGRSIQRIRRARLLQTDAAINPGNSGGPLVNLNAEIVGINTAIATRTGGNQGVGFAIPINQAKWVVKELLEHGEVRRAMLGIQIGPLTAQAANQFGLRPRSGVWVVTVRSTGPAADAGLQADDVIVEFAGIPVRAPGDLQAAVEQQPIGSQQRIFVMREGRKIPLDVKVTTYSE